MPNKRTKKPAGHAEHTKEASQHSLPGEMKRPIKITMLGAGSSFTPRLITDVISIPGSRRSSSSDSEIERV